MNKFRPVQPPILAPALQARARLPRPDENIGFAPEQFIAAALSALFWAGMCLLAFLISPAPAHAQPALVEAQSGFQALVQQEVQGALKQSGTVFEAGQGSRSPRVELALGQLDPRLKLAPCDKVRAFMPAGTRLWGSARVGLRCEQGPVRWTVYWPVTVKVWGPALVVARSARVGDSLSEADVQVAEVDLAAGSPAVQRVSDIIGRKLARNLEAGHSLRQDDLKVRRWFAAGDMVQLLVRGSGFQVAAEGTALTPGDEGQCARIRTENGKVVCGQPVGERRVELSL
jgi:flagellar basal body P-ring formation protein FlgA